MTTARAGRVPEDVREAWQRAMQVLQSGGVPFLVGGAFALEHYTGVSRPTKDLDLFMVRGDWERAADVLSAAGFRTELLHSHWLAKARLDDRYLDLVFGGGNTVGAVDEEWFRHAVAAEVLGVPARICPPEEIVWSKAFVQERERFDGADVLHVLRARAESLEWPRLLDRFGAHWRVLLAHLVIFGFVYPSERQRIPASVMTDLMRRLDREAREPAAGERVCYGALLSREQYRPDLESWGYEDPRAAPRGALNAEELNAWNVAGRPAEIEET